jgi:hypothetical protein
MVILYLLFKIIVCHEDNRCIPVPDTIGILDLSLDMSPQNDALSSLLVGYGGDEDCRVTDSGRG